MNIITVIPLTRQKVAESLSYFTAAEAPVGAIVSVPLRSKSIHAVVTESRPAEDVKAEIRKAPFEIRKLDKVKATRFFPASFMETCRILSDYYATTPGAVIDSLVADALLEQAHRLSPPLPPQADLWNGAATGSKGPARETYVVQGDDADRVSTWRSLIRQEFARKRSIVIYVPTVEDVKGVRNALERGIEGYIFSLHAGLQPKKIAETWSAVAETVHPVVIVSTGSFILLPRDDIETVVIERENARGWIPAKAPYLDLRHAIEAHARLQRQTVFLSDSLLRTETLRRLEMHDVAEGSPFKWRSVSTALDHLVDMRAFKAAENGHRLLSPDLIELIRQNRDDSTHLFVMAARRGHSPSTVCSDCETIVSCTHCTSPLVLHVSRSTGKNFYLCHSCGERYDAERDCAVCGSWRLTPLGLGIDRVAQEIKQRFPEIEIFQVDADTTTTEKQVDEAIAAFRAKPGSILLGTEMAAAHLGDTDGRKIDHVAVASLDSLLSLPDFRIHEKIAYALVRLRSLAARSILVQTRRPEEKAFEYGLKGNLSDWNRYNQEERARFSYPPYAVLIKLTAEGKKNEIAELMADVQKLVEPREIDIFPAFTSTVRGKSVIHGLIRIEPHAWPDPELVKKLRSLPHGISIKINPESLL